ncbi:MAG: hypothetical protein K2G35_08690 [Duncaniella sp.]|nr:hypothetical protein [Duncaniella sp.]
MKKNITIETAVIASTLLSGNQSLSAAKLSRLEGTEKFAVVRAATALRPIREGYLSAEQTAQESLRPDNWNELLAQTEKWDSLTADEKAAHNAAAAKYNAEVGKYLAEERAKTAEVEITPLDEAALGRFLDSNPDWDVEQASLMLELFTDTDTNQKTEE